jgi:GH18 family chitinase
VFLTVYNCSDHWDWNWAMAAYKTNKDKFIESLVSQCEQYDLDGVDIDFEGGTQTGGGTELQLEREPFTEFVKELGTQLHQAGRELSICSFHSPCWNAPNMAWWPDWVGYVDHARLMGYWDDYEASERELLDEGTCWGLPTETKPTRYFKYSWKSEWGLSCGFDSTVVSIGMPSENGMDNWGGQGCQAHIQDNLNLPSPMGVCIWESELAGAWKDARTWELLKQVRDINPPHSNVTRVKEPQNPANHIAGEVSIIKNSLMITVPHTGRFTVSIYDLSGKRILNMEVVRLAKGKNRLNAGMGEKAPGIYVCKVRGKDLLLTNTINTN